MALLRAHEPLVPAVRAKGELVPRVVHLLVSGFQRRNVAVTAAETTLPVTTAEAFSATQFGSDPDTLLTVTVADGAVVVVVVVVLVVEVLVVDVLVRTIVP